MSLEVDAEWTKDCGGKMDFDADIVELSCRYYPLGWCGDIVAGGEGPRPDIKPHASCSILFHHHEDDIELAKAEFESETQEEVQMQVEQWAQNQFNVIAGVLAIHFSKANSCTANSFL